MLSLKKNFRNQDFALIVIVQKTFGDWLKVERMRAKLTQEELVTRADNVCTSAYISNLERNADIGKKGRPTQPDIDIVDALALALGVSIAEAREAAGYAAPENENSSLTDFASIISNYEQLSPKTRVIAKKLIIGTLKTLSDSEREGVLNGGGNIKSNGQTELILRETSDEERERYRALRESEEEPDDI